MLLSIHGGFHICGPCYDGKMGQYDAAGFLVEGWMVLDCTVPMAHIMLYL